MKTTYVVLIIAASILSGSSALAETGRAGQAGDFMKFGLGARPLGMGSAFAGIAEGIDGIYYNTAGIAFATHKQVGLTYHSLSLDRNLNSAAVMSPVRNEAVLAFSWINSSVGNVLMRDSDRNPAGEFRNSTNAFALSFAKAASERFAFAGNLRYYTSRLDELTSSTVGADLGAMLRCAGRQGPSEKFAAGLAIQDIGSNHRWDSGAYWSNNEGSDYTDRFPLRIRGGMSASLLENTLITAVDIVQIQHLTPKFHAGAEYWFVKQVNVEVPEAEYESEEARTTQVQNRVLGLRAGYDDGSLTFGASLYYPYGEVNGGLDYAFVSGKRGLDATHVFTVRLIY